MTIQELTNMGYTDLVLINDQLCGLQRFVFTSALIVGLDSIGYKYRYCYHTMNEAREALQKYSNLSEHPTGNWIKRKGEGGDLSNTNYKK